MTLGRTIHCGNAKGKNVYNGCGDSVEISSERQESDKAKGSNENEENIIPTIVYHIDWMFYMFGVS